MSSKTNPTAVASRLGPEYENGRVYTLYVVHLTHPATGGAIIDRHVFAREADAKFYSDATDFANRPRPRKFMYCGDGEFCDINPTFEPLWIPTEAEAGKFTVKGEQ